MPNFQVTAPDGKNYQVTAPDGATQDQVMAYVQQQHGAQAPQEQPQQPQQSPLGEASGMLMTGLQHAASTGTFGLSDVASAGLASVLSKATPNPMSYQQARQKVQANADASTAENPVSAVAGDIAGAIAPTKLLAAAMPFKNALALRTAAQGGTKLGNAARLAGQGALVGGTYGAASGAVEGAQDDGIAGAAGGLVKGGAEGAALGAAGDLAAAGVVKAVPTAWKSMFSDAGQKSIAVLAKAFGKSPNDVGDAVTKFRLDTGGVLNPTTGRIDGGRMPAMGELTDLWNRGEIASVVSKNPNLGAPVAQAADDAATAFPGRMAEHVEGTIGGVPLTRSPAATETLTPLLRGGEDPATLGAARENNMDVAMKPIRHGQIPLDPNDVEFIRREILPNSGLTQNGRRLIHEDLDQGVLTVGNADTLRQNLWKLARANPGESYDDAAKGITQLATDASPEYGTALKKYAQDSNYIDAHAHGLTGKTIGQIDAKDDLLRKALASPEGQQGYQSGIATRMANRAFASEGGAASTAADLSQQAGTSANLGNTFSPIQVDNLRSAAGAESQGLESLKAIAPTMPKSQEKPGVNVGQLAMAGATHSAGWKVLHAVKALTGGGMSDNVARVTARYLTDPSMTEQGVNLLRRHGVKQEQIQRLMQQAGAVGAVAANGQ